jgi:uncharacterized membrane protein
MVTTMHVIWIIVVITVLIIALSSGGGRTAQQRRLERRVHRAKQEIEAIGRETQAAIRAEARRQAGRWP